MLVGGVCEVQMPLALQLAVKTVLGAQGIWSTEMTVARAPTAVNRNVNNSFTFLWGSRS